MTIERLLCDWPLDIQAGNNDQTSLCILEATELDQILVQLDVDAIFAHGVFGDVLVNPHQIAGVIGALWFVHRYSEIGYLFVDIFI